MREGRKELIERLKRRKTGIMKFPTRSGEMETRKFIILKYVIHRQSNYPDKYFVVDLIRPSWRRTKELRFGYYIIGKKRRAKGRWTWGQYCPLIPLKDLRILLRKAKTKGLI